MAIEPALFVPVREGTDLEAACERAAEIGYGAVEIKAQSRHLPADTPDERIASLGERLDELGLDVACLYTGTGGYDGKSDAEREAELDRLEPYLAFAEALDCGVVKHGVGGPPEFRAEEADYERAAAWLGRAADRAADYGVTVGLEIHGGSLIESAAAARDLVDRTGHESVGAIHDAGNMCLADEDFGERSVEVLGDRLVHLHVKDLARVGDASLPGAFTTETKHGEETFQHRPLGEGDADHGPLFGALVERGFDGYATTECLVPPAVLDGADVARHEYAAVREYIDAAGGERQ